MPPSLLIVGLGNPGARYQNTPHNVGFEVVDALAAKWRAEPWRAWKGRAAVADCRIGEKAALLAKPGTYMNLSGEAVRPLLDYHGLEPAALLVISDDIALPVGRTRLRAEGSSGGQKGLQSIIDMLGTAEYARLRLGVAPGEEGLPCPSEKWVLSKWSPTLRAHMDRVIEQAVGCVEAFVEHGLERAMGLFNGKRVPGPGEE